jgi:Uma2 family endonuclease
LDLNVIDRESPTMSTAVATRTDYTPEDLLAMPDGESYELVGGQLVERKMGAESSWVGTRLISRLERFCEENSLGWTFTADNGYQCFPYAPSLVRKPDVSFVRYGRLPGGVLPKGWIKIRPDLAVEVVSPNDTAEELDEKLEDYERAGIPLIWVVFPKSRTVKVYCDDGSFRRLREEDELSGEDIIPGFRCPVREILPRHEPPTTVPSNPNGTAEPGQPSA